MATAYPIFLSLSGRTVLLLGDGETVDRRARQLLACGAMLRRASLFMPSCLDGCVLAIGADAPEDQLRALSSAAQARGVPVNIVDRPELSTYATPSVVDRGLLQIAIGTSGAAPVLGRLIRAKIEAVIAPAWERVAALADEMRGEARAAIPDVAKRRHVLERVFSGPIADMAMENAMDQARARFRATLASAEDETGFVWLVGAGPGASDLVTLRGARVLSQADVIVHDRLGTREVLSHARRDAEFVDVGKSLGNATMPQRDINAMLISRARAGKRVVRLKGGDPFIFGRGGEEVAALRASDIPCAVVPGVTAASACAASALLPLTHRDYAHAVTLVTAHRRGPDLGIDYDGILRPGVTLAVYMGLATLPRLCSELEAAGYDAGMPAVMVESGGTDSARVLRGPLSVLAEQAPAALSGGPVLILLGGTAASP